MTAAELLVPTDRDNKQRIPSRRDPISASFDGFTYEVHRVTRENIWGLRHRVLPFEKEFGYANSFATHDKVKHYVQEGGEVEFARTLRNPQDVGVTTQRLVKPIVDGQTVRALAVGIRVVLPDFQKHHIATNLAVEAIIRLRPYVVTGQTRTWRIIRMYQDTGLISSILPIDGPMTPDIQGVLGQVLEEILDKRTLRATDLTTGLCVGIYPPGESERFMRPSTNQRGQKIYDRMMNLGADPRKGNGIRYYAVVDQEAVLERIASRRLEQKTVSLVRPNPFERFFGSMGAIRFPSIRIR